MADARCHQRPRGYPAPSPAIWKRRSVLGGLVAARGRGAGFALHDGAGQAYVTQLGEIRRVPLGDGSVMTINSDTELKVHLASHAPDRTGAGRGLVRGRQGCGPSLCRGFGQCARPRGGHRFSVRKREGGVEVLVTEGIVETWSDADSGQRVRVVAGERALISERAVVHYQASETASVDRALAWRNGMIDLNGTTLRDAAEEFNRYNQCQIVIADPNVAAEQFDGLFRISDPEGFAEALKTSLGVSVNTSEPNDPHRTRKRHAK
jgi:transmembrane sensor